MKVYVVVTLQGSVPFPIDVDVFSDWDSAYECAERIREQYHNNKTYVFCREIKQHE